MLQSLTLVAWRVAVARPARRAANTTQLHTRSRATSDPTCQPCSRQCGRPEDSGSPDGSFGQITVHSMLACRRRRCFAAVYCCCWTYCGCCCRRRLCFPSLPSWRDIGREMLQQNSSRFRGASSAAVNSPILLHIPRTFTRIVLSCWYTHCSQLCSARVCYLCWHARSS